MKKTLKLLTLPILTLVLVGCNFGGNNTQEVTTVTEITTVASTTENQVSTPNDTTTVAESTTTSEDSSNAEVSETDVPIKLYVNGTLTKEFVAKDAVGSSVLDAMNSISELDFFFDEDEGFIPQIDGYENDYSAMETWVYLLNGEYAELGVVSQTLSAGDVVEWYYGTVEELPATIRYAE